MKRLSVRSKVFIIASAFALGGLAVVVRADNTTAPASGSAPTVPTPPAQGGPQGGGPGGAPGSAPGSMHGPGGACKADVQQFCANVQPGQGRIIHCLHDNKDKLSDGCKRELRALHRRRMQGGAQGGQGGPSSGGGQAGGQGGGKGGGQAGGQGGGKGGDQGGGDSGGQPAGDDNSGN